MPRTLASAVVTVLFAVTTPALAANWADDRDPAPEFARSKAICRSLKGMPSLPRAISPGGTAPSKRRSSEVLYYGIGVPPDPAAAWQAALRERTAADNGTLFSGDVMLMTMYANGIGAPRDLDRAIAIACTLDGAPAEQDGRVNHLAMLKAQHWQGRDFSFCDDITSGYAQGFCAKHDAAVADAARNQRFGAVTAGWSEADKRAFLPLQRAAAAYAEARAGNEVDQSGTARAAMAIEAQQGQEAEFLDMLLRLEKGAAPAATPEQADAADAKLNAVYQRVQRTADTASWGTVTKDGIRTAQRAWLRYRDAWTAFGRVRYPSVIADSLRAMLTEQRTTALEQFLQ